MPNTAASIAEQIRRAAAAGRSIVIDPLAAPGPGKPGGAVRVQLRHGCDLVAFEVTACQLETAGADNLVGHLLGKLADLIDAETREPATP